MSLETITANLQGRTAALEAAIKLLGDLLTSVLTVTFDATAVGTLPVSLASIPFMTGVATDSTLASVLGAVNSTNTALAALLAELVLMQSTTLSQPTSQHNEPMWAAELRRINERLFLETQAANQRAGIEVR